MLDDARVNVLIVDDHPEGHLAMGAVLDRSHYNIISASSGEEALARVLSYDFGVIIMDVQMPGMDGFETVKLIKKRERSRDIPVIFLTAHGRDMDLVRRGYESGAMDYIAKPFDPQILASKVSLFAELYLKNERIKEQGALLRQAEVRERGRQLATLQLESLNRYRHLADAVPHIVWKLQSDGRLEYSNRQWLHYSGLSQEQSSGVGWYSMVHPDDLRVLLEKLKIGRDLSDGFEAEVRLLHGLDQVFYWHMFRAVPEFSVEGDVTAWVVTNTDIEDRKKAERALIEAKEASSAANHAKSAFLANMSHEIRTPLGIVLGYADLLANTETPADQRLEYAETIKRNGELLSRLIGDILDLSKVEAGFLTVEKVQFSLLDFLKSATQSFQHQVNDKNIQLKMVLRGEIPVTITSDPMRLRQILFNIVSNAIKFTDQGDITIFVEMGSMEPGKETLQISVVDQGLGITSEQAKKLFQPFIQADSSTTRKYGGTGLGLSLSRKLARQLDGDVVLAPTQEGPRGSTFVITIGTSPLKGIQMTRVLELELASPVPIEAERPFLNGANLLVVEDSPDNQFLLKLFLTSAGAQVTLADNGEEGCRKALEGNFDLVLMDIQMPVLDGYEATKKLRQSNYQKPILALTAYALKGEKDRCVEVGCNDHLTKPIDRQNLLEHVARYIYPEATL